MWGHNHPSYQVSHTSLDERLARLAHSVLDECPDFESGKTGPAVLARWLYEQLEPVVPGLEGAPDLRLTRVEVWDTPESGAAYSA